MTESRTNQTLLVQSPTSLVVHRGRKSRLLGHVVTDCNGRTMTGFVFAGDPADVTCARCIKQMPVVKSRGSMTR